MPPADVSTPEENTEVLREVAEKIAAHNGLTLDGLLYRVAIEVAASGRSVIKANGR